MRLGCLYNKHAAAATARPMATLLYCTGLHVSHAHWLCVAALQGVEHQCTQRTTGTAAAAGCAEEPHTRPDTGGSRWGTAAAHTLQVLLFVLVDFELFVAAFDAIMRWAVVA